MENTPLEDLLESALPDVARGHGWRTRLAQLIGITPAAISGWIKVNAVPPGRVEEVADLLQLSAEVRAELRRRGAR